MPEQDVSVGQLLLFEYQNVKDEQKARIGFRDNLLYVTLAVVAAVATASAQSGQTSMLLVLSVLEAFVVVGLAVQVTLYAGVFGSGRRSPTYLSGTKTTYHLGTKTPSG